MLGNSQKSSSLGAFPVPAVAAALIDEFARLGQRRLVAKQPPPVQQHIRYEQQHRSALGNLPRLIQVSLADITILPHEAEQGTQGKIEW